MATENDDAQIDPEPPESYHYAWVPESEIRSAPLWELVAPADAKPCRFTVAYHETCRRPSVARMKRNTQWWHYCARHLFGRRIRNQVVEVRILVPDAPEGA